MSVASAVVNLLVIWARPDGIRPRTARGNGHCRQGRRRAAADIRLGEITEGLGAGRIELDRYVGLAGVLVDGDAAVVRSLPVRYTFFWTTYGVFRSCLVSLSTRR